MPRSKPTPALRAMEDEIALQDKEDTEKTARIEALCSRFEAAARQRLQAGDKRITWSSSAEASIGQGDVVRAPPHYARGTPHAASGKQEKLAAQLATAEWDSAAANARNTSLWSNQGDLTVPCQLRMLLLQMNLKTPLMEHPRIPSRNLPLRQDLRTPPIVLGHQVQHL
jgi:hypothetical protein